MRRCYANPAVMRYFRSYFTRSGFQIVDCPPLTGRGKNSADIYMVVDMLDALKHETRFDEFIILSGDADFTPVLLRLRAYDRTSVIYSNAVTAPAYKSLCDAMITEERLIDLTGGDGEGEDPAQAAAPMPVHSYVPESQPPVPDRRPPERPVARAPERPVERGPERERDGADRNRSYDRRRPVPVRPSTPDPLDAALVDAQGRPIRIAPELAPLARRVNAATNVPMFASEIYAALFRTLANDVRENGFSFNRTVNAVIRRLGDAGLKLRPQHVGFVVKGLMLSGHAFLADETAETLAQGFRRQVLYLCSNEDLTLTAAEREAVGLWIVGGLSSLSESEIRSSDPIETDATLAAELAGVDLDAEALRPMELREAEDGQLGDGDSASDYAPEDEADHGEALADGSDFGDDGDSPEARVETLPVRQGPDLEKLLERIRSPGRP